MGIITDFSPKDRHVDPAPFPSAELCPSSHPPCQFFFFFLTTLDSSVFLPALFCLLLSLMLFYIRLFLTEEMAGGIMKLIEQIEEMKAQRI